MKKCSKKSVFDKVKVICTPTEYLYQIRNLTETVLWDLHGRKQTRTGFAKRAGTFAASSREIK